MVAVLDLDEGDQPAAFRDDVELAHRSRITPRQDAPAGEAEPQRAEPLRRQTPLMGGAARRQGSAAHPYRGRTCESASARA